VATAVASQEGSPLLVVVPTLEEAGRWSALLELMGWPSCQLYPTSEGSPYEPFDPTSEISWGQLQVLAELLDGNRSGGGGESARGGGEAKPWRGVIVATERALQPHLPPPAMLAEHCLSLRRGESVAVEELGQRLTQLGYARVATIEQEGTWSRRGDIVDVFPVSAELPVRLEFFGEDIEKLREFDPASQRSLDAIDVVRITPTSVAPLVADALREALPEGLEALLEPAALEMLIEGGTPEGLRRLMGLAWGQPASLLDYLPADCWVAIDERRHGVAHGQAWWEHAGRHRQEVIEDLVAQGRGDASALETLVPPALHRPPAEALAAACERFAGFDLAEMHESDGYGNDLDLASRAVAAHPNQFGRLASAIKGHLRERERVWIVSAQPSRAVALLEEHDCVCRFVPNAADRPAIERLVEQGTPVALKSKGSAELEGLQLPAWKLVLLTDREIFGQHSLAATGWVRRRRRAASRTVDPNRMVPGDFVVHRTHGIAS
jgi:transcription-repair coupling factor (superfamily II helicase)